MAILPFERKACTRLLLISVCLIYYFKQIIWKKVPSPKLGSRLESSEDLGPNSRLTMSSGHQRPRSLTMVSNDLDDRRILPRRHFSGHETPSVSSLFRITTGTLLAQVCLQVGRLYKRCLLGRTDRT